MVRQRNSSRKSAVHMQSSIPVPESLKEGNKTSISPRIPGIAFFTFFAVSCVFCFSAGRNYDSNLRADSVLTEEQHSLRKLSSSLSSSSSAKVVNDETNLESVGSDGGAWTAETHLAHYGFNVDWGLLEVLETACRDIENSRIPDGENKWELYMNGDDPNHALNGYWKSPKTQYVNCRVLEIGCGVGVYVDAFVKEQAKKRRRVIGVEPNEMGGTFKRSVGGPKQLAINILGTDNPFAYGQEISQQEVKGEGFDLIYSIEVFEHMPPEKHEDAVKFLAGAAHKGTKLIFGAGHPGQGGVGHIGLKKTEEWEAIMKKYGFIKDAAETTKAVQQMNDFNHRVNTNVYFYNGGV